MIPDNNSYYKSQKVKTPKILNCFCGESTSWETIDFGQCVMGKIVCRNGHSLTNYCFRHRAVCIWNNRVKKMTYVEPILTKDQGTTSRNIEIANEINLELFLTKKENPTVIDVQEAFEKTNEMYKDTLFIEFVTFNLEVLK